MSVSTLAAEAVMADQVILYFFKLRSDTKPEKWHKSRWRMTVEEARARYGEGNYEVLPWSKEVREVGDPASIQAGHLYR